MVHLDESCPIVLNQQWESSGKLAVDPYRPWMLLDRQIGLDFSREHSQPLF